MAIVGEAHIIVRAITNRVDSDIRRGFNGSNSTGRRAGQDMGRNFVEGFRNSTSGNIFGQLRAGLQGMSPEAEDAAKSFHALVRTGFAMQAGLGSLVGGVSSLVGALGALIGAAGQAGASLVVMGNGIFAGVSALAVAKTAFGGIGKAIGLATKAQASGGKAAKDNGAAQEAAARRVQQAQQSLARTIESNREQLINANNAVRDSQLALNRALQQGAEDLQQLGFDAEDAALGERRAALNLQEALQRLQGVQDLPPNDAARKDAELSYQEAELAYRRAKDRNADLSKENADAAAKGVAGTQVVVDAQKNLDDAQAARAKTVRDGARQEADARQAVVDALKAQADAQKNLNTASAGAPDPFAGLTASQEKFARYLISLLPRLRRIKEAAAAAFLPPLQQAIDRLMQPNGLYGVILAGVPIIGRALGSAANSISRALSDPKTLGNITALFSSSGKLISNFGAGLGEYIKAFSTILRAAIPLAERFSGFLLQNAKNFNRFIQDADRGGALTDFFNAAGDTMAKFGTIFGNVLSGLGAMIRANMGPGSGGQMLLDFFIQGTNGLKSLNTIAGQSKLRQYFIDVVQNAMPLLSLVKQLAKMFIGLGTDQNIGTTFGILQQAVEPLRQILKAGIDAGPAFATVVVHVARLIAALADTGAPTAFFETLDSIITPIMNFVESPANKDFLNTVGVILAKVSAFTFVGLLAAKGITIFVGSLGLMFEAASAIISPFLAVGRVIGIVFTTLRGGGGILRLFVTLIARGGILGTVIGRIGIFFLRLGGVIRGIIPFITRIAGGLLQFGGAILRGVLPILARMGGFFMTLVRTIFPLVINGIRLLGLAIAANPIGAIITAIVLVIAALVWFFTQTELGKQIWAEFCRFLQEAWDNIVTYFQQTFDFLSNVFQAAWISIQTGVAAFIAIVQGYFNIFVAFWTGVFQIIGSIVQNAWNVIVGLIQTAITFIVTYVQLYLNLLMTIWTSIWNGIFQAVVGIWNALVTFVQTAITNIQNIINNVLAIIVAIFTGQWGKIPALVGGIFQSINNIIGGALRLIQSVIGSILGGIATTFRGVFNGIRTFIGGVLGAIGTVIRNATRIFGEAFENVGRTIRGVFDNIGRTARGAINTVIDVFNGGIRSLNGLHFKLPDILPPPLGGATIGLHIPTIPKLAKGGIVMPSAGGSLVNVAEAGRPERIEPLDAQGLSARDRAIIAQLAPAGAGMTFNIHAAPGMSVQELSEAVGREVAYQMRKGSF